MELFGFAKILFRFNLLHNCNVYAKYIGDGINRHLLLEESDNRTTHDLLCMLLCLRLPLLCLR